MRISEIINSPSANFLDPNICIISDFLDKEMHRNLLNLAINSKDEDWYKARKNHRFIKPLDIPTEVTEVILDKVRTVLPGDYDLQGFSGISRMFAKDSMAEHHDEAGRPALYGLVYYLNGDIEGGKIHYTKKGLRYQPVANSLVIHPSTFEYSHEVEKVISGIRYSSVGFGYRTDVEYKKYI